MKRIPVTLSLISVSITVRISFATLLLCYFASLLLWLFLLFKSLGVHSEPWCKSSIHPSLFFQIETHQRKRKRSKPIKLQYSKHSEYIQYTIYNIQYSIHNTQYTIFNIQYTIHNIQYKIFNTQYTIFNIQHTLYKHKA